MTPLRLTRFEPRADIYWPVDSCQAPEDTEPDFDGAAVMRAAIAKGRISFEELVAGIGCTREELRRLLDTGSLMFD